jgi:hypothetical protein
MRERLSAETPLYDADDDGLGGIYDCDDTDPSVPRDCPLASPEPGRPVWCDDGLPVPESRSLMNWVNQVVTQDEREMGLREYLYDHQGRDQVPDRCGVALMALRGGPQDSNTEQLTRYVVEGLGPDAVGYVLAGRSRWPFNAEDWDYPNHMFDTSCPAADGRTRMRDVHRQCAHGITLRRTSPWDPCGRQYEGEVILVGGGLPMDEYPKANIVAALEGAVRDGKLPSIRQIVDIDSLHWSDACRAAFAARGCCHSVNHLKQFSGKAGVQLVLSTNTLGYGPVCKVEGDPLLRYDCSELSSNADLAAIGDILRAVLGQPQQVRKILDSGGGVEELAELGPLGDPALIEIIQSELSPRDKATVLTSQSPLSNTVLTEFLLAVDNPHAIEQVLVANTPLSVVAMTLFVETVDTPWLVERVLLENGPWLPESVLLAALDQPYGRSLARLLVSLPDLTDPVLIKAVEVMKAWSAVAVLRAHCPLSEEVLAAAEARLSKKDFRKIPCRQGNEIHEG